MESQLLDAETAERIVTMVRTAMGDHLRSITYFTRDDYDQLYLRDDLERDADLTSFIGNEWYGFEKTQNAYQNSELGEYQYTIRVFENGYLIRITSDHDGVFLTTDGLTTKRFEEVTAALREEIEDR